MYLLEKHQNQMKKPQTNEQKFNPLTYLNNSEMSKTTWTSSLMLYFSILISQKKQ